MIITVNGQKANLPYIRHILPYENLINVLKYGVLSHNEVYKRKLIKEDISMREVQQRRANKPVLLSSNKVVNLHNLVSFYFKSKNPMLHVRSNQQYKLIILDVSSELIINVSTSSMQSIFTDGNAASNRTKFFNGVQNLHNVPFDVIFGNSKVSDVNEWKRKMCSEILVYPSVPVEYIKRIVVPNIEMQSYCKAVLSHSEFCMLKIPIVFDSRYFH